MNTSSTWRFLKNTTKKPLWFKNLIYTPYNRSRGVHMCMGEQVFFPRWGHHPPPTSHHLAVLSLTFSTNHFHAIFIATWKANKCHAFSGGEGLWQGTPNIMQMSGYVPLGLRADSFHIEQDAQLLTLLSLSYDILTVNGVCVRACVYAHSRVLLVSLSALQPSEPGEAPTKDRLTKVKVQRRAGCHHFGKSVEGVETSPPPSPPPPPLPEDIAVSLCKGCLNMQEAAVLTRPIIKTYTRNIATGNSLARITT